MGTASFSNLDFRGPAIRFGKIIMNGQKILRKGAEKISEPKLFLRLFFEIVREK
jgi:hypothetical protein